MRGGIIILALACAAGSLLLPGASSAWFLDGGLESKIGDMRALFREKKLPLLYAEHVDRKLKNDIEAAIGEMKKDRANGFEISRRLRFRSYPLYLQAGPEEVVNHFFAAMLDPAKKKQRPVGNASYLKLALILSLLFAPFDKDMSIVDREIAGGGARVYFAGNGFRMAAYFAERNGRWYLTSENYLGDPR